MNRMNKKQALAPIVRIIGVVFVVALMAAASSTMVAADDLGSIGSPGTAFAGGPVFFDSGYSYPFRASTPAESFARGRAEVIRAQGEYNRLTSEAAINVQQALSGAIDNAQKGVDAYFRIREMNRDYRQAERGPKPTREDFQRYARAGLPTPLSPSELDTLTGRVRWPILLRDDHFASLRAELEELLDRWAVSRNLGQVDSFGTDDYLAVRNAIDHMQDELRTAVGRLHPQDYASSQRFLRSLEYQVLRAPTSSASLADSR